MAYVFLYVCKITKFLINYKNILCFFVYFVCFSYLRTMKDIVMEHPLLGRIEVTCNARARKFIFRAEEHGLRVTSPTRATQKELYQSIEKILPRLLELKERFKQKHVDSFIDENFCISATHFSMKIVQGNVRRPAARFVSGELTITCPVGTDFHQPELQTWFVKVAEESLRHQAKRILPERLKYLAEKYGFTYNEVHIHKTHGRWGSCNVKKNINLSLYLLLLPDYLQDYVMLHELCHTIEMNHGPRFWKKMDEVTDNRAMELRQETRNYDTSIFSCSKS